MMKIDFYTQIHKALRRWLFAISMQLAVSNFNDIESYKEQYQEILQLIKLLRLHAKHEQEFFHPLITKKFNKMEIQLTDEHQLQERWLLELEEEGRAILSANSEEQPLKGLAFYKLFNRFIAHYLLHMDEEESLMPRLQEKYTEEELKKAIIELFSSLTQQELFDSVEYMLPALNPKERLEMMQSLVSSDSREFSNKIYQEARKVLSEEDWKKLSNDLLYQT